MKFFSNDSLIELGLLRCNKYKRSLKNYVIGPYLICKFTKTLSKTHVDKIM